MMVDKNIEQLAETLARSGLAASPGEARRMAQNILGTEKKVSRNFYEKKEQITKSLERKKTYQEEIDELIEKTSPHNKNFHVPIRGYEVEEKEKKDSTHEKKQFLKEEPQCQKPDNRGDILLNIERQLDELKYMKTPSETSLSPDSGKSQSNGMLKREAEAKENLVGQGNKEEKVSVAPVYTDVIEDERTLIEIMNETSEEIYKNAELNLRTHGELRQDGLPLREAEKPADDMEISISEAPQQSQDDEFILTNVMGDERIEETQNPQLFTEVKTEKSEQPRNPIEKIDLLDYFKFSS